MLNYFLCAQIVTLLISKGDFKEKKKKISVISKDQEL